MGAGLLAARAARDKGKVQQEVEEEQRRKRSADAAVQRRRKLLVICSVDNHTVHMHCMHMRPSQGARAG